MTFRVTDDVAFDDDTLRIDHEGLALRETRDTHDVIAVRNLLVRVRENGEGQSVFVRKLLVRFDVIDADAEDLRIRLAKRKNVVAEFASLRRAAGRLIFRIEVQRDPLAAVVLQLMPFA